MALDSATQSIRARPGVNRVVAEPKCIEGAAHLVGLGSQYLLTFEHGLLVLAPDLVVLLQHFRVRIHDCLSVILKLLEYVRVD